MSKTLFDDEATPMPKVTALAPWFGSNRMLAHEVGKELAGCKWVGVPFAGGMTELLYIDATTIVVSDIHRHVINLAQVAAHDEMGPKLIRALRRQAFHPDVHAAAQGWCKQNAPACHGDLEAAFQYFTAVWMNRSAMAGIDDEFTGRLPVRWNANGGDSNKRYRSATEALLTWRKIFRRCNFVVMDVFDMLAKAQDEPRHGLYCDPPFPGPGDRYKHQFTEDQHRQLAAKLATFQKCKVVCRFYDHPLIRELYPEGERWKWRRLKGRDQSNNNDKPEVLITGGG